MIRRKTPMRRPDPVLRELTERLRERYGDRIRSILLFGSRARGDHDPVSDYDIMVLVDRKTPELDSEIFQLGCEIDYRRNTCLSLFVEEQSHFDGKKYEPLFMNIRKEGMLL